MGTPEDTKGGGIGKLAGIVALAFALALLASAVCYIIKEGMM